MDKPATTIGRVLNRVLFKIIPRNMEWRFIRPTYYACG